MTETYIPERVRAIMRDVSAEYQVSISDMRGKYPGIRRISDARHCAMRKIRALENPKPSMVKIGAWFNRDHSTVVYACRGKRR